MNVLLLGNGFDINYKLPTKYANFLHVANHIASQETENLKTLGDILSQETLQKEDPFIKTCYETHKHILDYIAIDRDKINELSTLVQKNKWFSFFLKSFNKDVGWIDFEKEIAFVISCFDRILPQKGTMLLYKDNRDIKHVVEVFDFLIDEEATRKSYTIGGQVVKKEFCIEHPLGSGNFNVSKEKVAKFLYNELLELSHALKLYLSCFVESTYDLLHKDGTCKRLSIFSKSNTAVTFNYTSTYERLYFNKSAFHIHGQLSKNIVLGVNPNSYDNLESVDTSFITFKKYFQRTLFETDYEYLRWISDIKHTNTTYRLIVMGHSLDVTDKDIILDLFKYANEIIVLYHSDEAKASYIANLITLHGKDGFDLLRKEQMLTFLPLDSDLSKLAEKMEQESYAQLVANLESHIV